MSYMLISLTNDMKPCGFQVCMSSRSFVSFPFENVPLQENVYPIGPSVQFYKMYLDPVVAEEVKEYDALAVIEWDVVVAHPTSFGKLYDAAFSSSEPFWVKGSTLAGTEFHETAGVTEFWHILGHLNGNALCESRTVCRACSGNLENRSCILNFGWCFARQGHQSG